MRAGVLRHRARGRQWVVALRFSGAEDFEHRSGGRWPFDQPQRIRAGGQSRERFPFTGSPRRDAQPTPDRDRRIRIECEAARGQVDDPATAGQTGEFIRQDRRRELAIDGNEVVLRDPAKADGAGK